jgi:Recombinase
VLTDVILDQLAKFERAKTAERTRRGRMREAQEGKIVGTGKAPYGFYCADDPYYLDQDRMVWVRGIFEMIAGGHSIYEVAKYLRTTGAPPPGGAGGKWHRTTIRNIILSISLNIGGTSVRKSARASGSTRGPMGTL